jgi:hypothetical protein
MNYEHNRIIQTVTSNKDKYKRKLLLRYFYEYEYLELNKLDFKLIYTDNKFYQYLLLPKRIYRTYYLLLYTPFSEERIQVGIKDKDDIKVILFEINKR